MFHLLECTRSAWNWAELSRKRVETGEGMELVNSSWEFWTIFQDVPSIFKIFHSAILAAIFSGRQEYNVCGCFCRCFNHDRSRLKIREAPQGSIIRGPAPGIDEPLWIIIPVLNYNNRLGNNVFCNTCREHCDNASQESFGGLESTWFTIHLCDSGTQSFEFVKINLIVFAPVYVTTRAIYISQNKYGDTITLF